MAAALPTDALVPMPARVVARRRETADVATLELELDGPWADGVAGGRFVRGGSGTDELAPRAFAPGQFNMLCLPGVGESAISLSGDPARPGRLVHTIRAVGAVSRALARLPKGAAVGVRGPYGVGWPLEAARGADVIVMAGGLGLAPLRPALYRLLAERRRYGRVLLLYGARSPAEVLYARELERWRRAGRIEVAITVDHAESEWQGHVGVVTTLLEHVAIDPAASLAMICGPEVMMRFAIAALQHRGVAPERIHVSMERNMKCGVGHCGHCQLGPLFICKDGPVLRYDRVADLLGVREL